jgi:hypothetical protein
MTVPADLTIEDGMAILRFTGEQAMSRAAERVTEALIYARENGIRQLLADALTATFIGESAPAAIYFRVQEWARAADGFVKLALLFPQSGRPETRSFGLTVAANSGLIAEIFHSEAEAREWLGRGQGASNPVRRHPPD